MSDSGLRGVRESDELSRLQREALLALALLASAAVLALVLFAADSFAGREAAEASHALPCADLNGNGLVTETDVDISFSFDEQAVPPAPPQVDQNSDGVIDILDHQAVAGQVGTSGVTCQDTPVDCAADVNRSGEVNETDTYVVISYFGQSSPPAPPQVDLDGDGMISIADIFWVIQRNGLVTDLIPCQDTGVDCLADLDGDGQITSEDVDIAMSWWGQSVPPAPYQMDLMLGDRDVSIHDVQFVAGRVGMSIEACQENPVGPYTPPLPDLAIGSIDGDSRGWPGEEITHRAVVENLGAGAAPATTLYVELLHPRLPISEFEYVPVGEFAVPALGAGEQAVVEYTATIPEWWDPYEFGRARHAVVSIDADDLIAEESEANNADSRQVGMSLFVYDVDGMGTADATDAQLVHALQGATHVSLEWNPDADVNEDGVLDADDVDAVLAHEGEVAGHAVPTLSVSPSSGVVPLAVTFNYEAHTHEGTISQLEIDFEGDGIWDLVVPAGTASISGSTQHTFTTVGVYEPTIRSTDSYGSLKTETTEVVAAPNLSLAQLIDNNDRGGIEAWSAVRTIAEINTAVAALDSAHRDDLAEVVLDSNATGSLRSTLLTVMQDVLSQPELGFFAEIWSYTYIEMVGGGFFGGCGHLYLDPGAYGGLAYASARGVLIHESFHSFNCINSGPSGALNEGSAIWIGQAVYSNPLLPGQSFAEGTYGTKLWYRDIAGSPNYPLTVADDPSDKYIEIFTWMSSQDPSGLPWNSQGRLTHCYESYWEHLDRDVDFYTVWLPAAEEAMQAMQGDPLCQPPSTPRVTGFEVDVRTGTTMKLSWEPVAGAESYERCVNDLPHTTSWICVDVGNISSELTAVPAAEGVYYYAVRGVAADGSTGPLSNRGVVTVINSTVDSVTYHSYHTAYKDSDGVKQVNSFNLGLASAYLGFSNWTDPDNVGSVPAGGRRHAVAQPWTDADLLSIYGPVVVALESPNASLSPQKWIGLSTLCMVIDESLCP